MNTMKNVLIEDNEIHMLSGATFAVVLVNEWDDNSSEAEFVFKGNRVTGEQAGIERGAPPNLVNSNSITIENNELGELQFASSENINIINNDIEAQIGHNGIKINNDISNSIFDSNTITIYPSLTNLQVECIRIPDDITLTAVTFENQTCIEN